MANPHANAGGPVDQADINDWSGRFSKALENKAWSSASPPEARPWMNSFFGCCMPIDTALITCCVPCVTFGKTHHRLRKNSNMVGYSAVNTSCLLFTLSSCFGAHWILQAMQMQDVREKHNLEGSCVGDLLKSCCCICCAVVQTEKESSDRVAEVAAVQEQYKAETMVMGPQK